jgi:stage II sporulation protein AA (anti-sigma F factor antagonist)
MANENPVMRFTQQGSTLIIGFDRDELYDGITLALLEEEFPALWAEDDHALWVFDFTGVKIVVSQVLALVLRSYKRLRERGGEARLCGLNSDVRRVFELMGLHQLLTIYHTPQDAIEAASLN